MISKIKRTVFVFNTFLIYSFNFLIGRKIIGQEILFKRLSKLGGIYIKFLQLLALNQSSPIINVNNFKDILAVYDQVTYEKIDINSILRSELGLKADSLKLDSNSPFAAGSFAQVYSATLNGQPIVIKVLRPSVDQYLRFDLALLNTVIHLVVFPTSKDILDLVSIFKDFKQVTLAEIDYQQEVNNAISMAKSLADHPVIYIPKTYTEFCTKRLIIQEKISGMPLTEVFSENIKDKVNYVQNILNTNLNHVMEELAVELLAGSLTEGGSHGDPHPGNIYLLNNNKIALIDFGIGSMVEKYQPELLQMVSQFAAMYRGEFNPEKLSQSLISYFAPKLTHSIQTISAYYGQENLVEQTLHEIGLSVIKTLGERNTDPAVTSLVEQYRVLKLFTQVINKNNRFGLQISFDSPAFLRSTQVFMQIIRRLNCDMQLLRRAWERVLVDQNGQESVQSVASYNNESIDLSLYNLASWFERLHYSDPSLYNRVMHTWEGAV